MSRCRCPLGPRPSDCAAVRFDVRGEIAGSPCGVSASPASVYAVRVYWVAMHQPAKTEFVAVPAPKRARTCLPFSAKMEILRLLAAGETVSSISRAFQVNESSIRTIAKNAEKIKSSVACSSPSLTGFTCRIRSPIITKTESVLMSWIESMGSDAQYTYSIVREKALSVYAELKKESAFDSNETFAASKGWYHKFSKRLELRNSEAKRQHESTVTLGYREELKSVIAAYDYKPQLIFTAHETTLFWKRMPTKAYGSVASDKAPGVGSTRERVKLLLCNNIIGTFKCKPLLVYKTNLPHSVIPKQSLSVLSVYARSNKSGTVACKTFEKWFYDCFCVDLKDYCAKNGLEYKGLLLLDNNPGHPVFPPTHPNIKVMFLPMDVTAALRPLYQGIVATFKLHYIKWIFTKIADSLREYGDKTVRVYLSQCPIMDMIENVSRAWNDTEVSNTNSMWSILFGETPHNIFSQNDFIDSSSVMTEIVNLGRTIGGEGFTDIEEADIIELLDSGEDPTIDVDDPKRSGIEHLMETDDGKCGNGNIDAAKLLNLILTSEQLITEVVNVDPNMERSMHFAKRLRMAVSGYKEMYEKSIRSTKS